MGFLTSDPLVLDEDTKRKIDICAKASCLSLADDIKGSINPDYYNELLRKHDKQFMKKMGIEDRVGYGIIYHVLHWVLKESGMTDEYYITNDGEPDRSRVYGEGIKKGLIGNNLKKYRTYYHERVRMAMSYE